MANLSAASSHAARASGRAPHGATDGTAARARNQVSRAHAFGDDDDGDDDDDDGRGVVRRSGGGSRRNGDEALVGYASTGALRADEDAMAATRGPKVILPPATSLNWWEERRKRLGLERYREELGGLVSMRTADSIPNGGARGAEAAPPQPPPAARQDARHAAQANGSQRERINDGEQKVGLQIRGTHRDDGDANEAEDDAPPRETAGARGERVNGAARQRDTSDATPPASQAGSSDAGAGEAHDDDDAAARRALLSGEGVGAGVDGRDAAASSSSSRAVIPIDETQAARIDAASRPSEPTLADYEAMPIHEFGAALLRGLGWKEGQGAGKRRDGPLRAPDVKKRGHLLGLGAKERATGGSGGGRSGSDASGAGSAAAGLRAARQRAQERERAKRYVPILRRETGGGAAASASSSEPTSSRRPSRSPPSRSSRHDDERRERGVHRDRDRDRDRDRERDRDGDGDGDGGRDQSRDRLDRERRRDRERGYDAVSRGGSADPGGSGRDGSRHGDERHGRERRGEREGRRDRDRDRERDRHGRGGGDGHRDARRPSGVDRDRERDGVRDRDRERRHDRDRRA